jgi:hypothetical protein
MSERYLLRNIDGFYLPSTSIILISCSLTIIEPLISLMMTEPSKASSYCYRLRYVLLFTIVFVSAGFERLSIYIKSPSLSSYYDLSWPNRNYSISAKDLWTSYANRLWPLEYLEIKGCSRRDLASGRFYELVLRQSLTKELNYWLHLEGSLKPWTGLSLSCHIAINGLRLELGTTPSASSIAVTPRDHISVLLVY